MERGPQDYEAPSCAQVGGDFWFAEKDVDDSELKVITDYRFAKSICNSCPHKIECAEWGLEHELWGMWGGLTPRERVYIRRRKNIFIKGDRSA
jgi:WhiB family transcriptional regulator, redox-sensing transcriptional regulator